MNQKEAFEILKLGYNIYLTGAAGSGKTYLLNKYIEYLKNNNIEVGVTASTGIAATHMNGRTIHSWAGLGIKDELTTDHLGKLLGNMKYKIRMLTTKVLIIDEVSMLHSFRLNMVDKVCRAFKQNNLPFGGIQVILSGDFFQLPPVSKKGEDNSFVYTSNAWQEMDIKICYLTEQHRQQDQNYLRVLNSIRSGDITNDILDLLTDRFNKPVNSDITPTKLYTHNIDVDAINNFELNKIEEKPRIYKMVSSGEPHLIEILKSGCLAPEELILKKCAVVMFVKNNFSSGYVNGTLGKVIRFDETGYPIVMTLKKKEITVTPAGWELEENGLKLAELTQVPLRLAWAITVHKSQGMSLDVAEIDLSKSFALGMGYVALSRVRTLSGIKLMGLNDMALQINKDVINVDREMYSKSQLVANDLSKISWAKKRRMQKNFLRVLMNK